jgi:hypothetical protein
LHDGTRWASSVITYSFPSYGASWSTNTLSGYGPSSGSGEPWSAGFGPLSSPGAGDDRTHFASALQRWANVANLSFVKVTDTASNVGDIRAAYATPSDNSTTTVAWAYYPGNAPAAGDIWFSTLNLAATDRWTPGSYAFLAVMHEIGHALGLKHPFDGSGDVSVTLPAAYDSQMYTIMSYAAKPGDDTTHFSFSPTTPMTLDIAAMQYVYGPNNSYHTADDTYAFSDASTYNETIWDAGGKDTIAYSGAYSAIIDLRPGSGSTIGRPVYVVSHYGANLYAVNNVWIAYGVTIENASGGNADDVITGNDAANSLMGGAGNDILDGGAGIDTAIYKDKKAGVTITKTTTGFTIKDTQGEGTDQLSNIERLQFADQKLALDLQPTEHAGQALEFIGLMAPELIKSPSAVGTILGLFDKGSSLHDVCQLAIDVGLVTAFAGSSSNAALAAMAFQNVVGTPSSAESVDMLLGYMDGRYASYTQADFMTVVAGLEVNQTHIHLVGLQQTGIEYV